MPNSVFLFLINYLLFGPYTSATTPLDGEISGHQVLSLVSSPYVVSQGVVVPIGSTLEVEPGVQVMFDPGVGLDVYGDLVANGTASQHIVFTVSDNVGNEPEVNSTEVRLVQKTRDDRGELKYSTH